MAHMSFDSASLGSEVVLTRRRRTAKRRHARSEFSNAIAFSTEPLLDRELFEVKLDEVHPSWGKSLMIGVTGFQWDSECFTPPHSALCLTEKTVLIGGSKVHTNGEVSLENYCDSLDDLPQGTYLGVAIVEGALHLYINGLDQGPAYNGIAAWAPLRAVLDLHGSCVQVSLTESTLASYCSAQSVMSQPLRFTRCPGSEVRLSFDRLSAMVHTTAEGSQALIFAVTDRPINENEIFEVEAIGPINSRGCFEVDVIGHLPTANLPLSPVAGVVAELSASPAFALQTHDRLRVTLQSGKVSIFVNGKEKHAIDSGLEHHYAIVKFRFGALTARLTPRCGQYCPAGGETEGQGADCTDSSSPPLCFHTQCGRSAFLHSSGVTAFRISPAQYNYAIVAGNRPLRPGELFEVQIDNLLVQWTGTLSIGITSLPPDEVAQLSSLSECQNSCWMLCSKGVTCQGAVRYPGASRFMQDVKVNDRFGIFLTFRGSLRFLVNGRDIGSCVSGFPTNALPVVDLYGQTAQVTLCQETILVADMLANESSFTDTPPPPEPAEIPLAAQELAELPLTFHERCGSHISLSQDRYGASRDSLEFNKGMCMTNRRLRPNEYFEVTVNEINSVWTGSLEIGVTTDDPSDVVFPEMASELATSPHVWLLCGDGIAHNGLTPHGSRYRVNLNSVMPGNRVGVFIHDTGDLHFTLNGDDCGCAAHNVPQDVFVIIDVFGRCMSVTINSAAVAPHSRDVVPGGGGVGSSVDHVVRGDAVAVLSLSSPEMSQASDSPDCDSDAASDDSQASLALRSGSYNPLHFPGETAVTRQSLAARHRTVFSSVLPSRQSVVREPFVPVSSPCNSNQQTFAAVAHARREQAPAESANKRDDDTPTVAQQMVEAKPFLHNIFGRNVAMNKERNQVARTHGFDHGIFFSQTPLQNGEIFEVSVVETNGSWRGNIGVGVVLSVPTNASQLPLAATQLSTESCCAVWLLSGSSLYHNGVVINRSLSHSMEQVKSGDVIGIQRHCDSSLRFFVNGERLDISYQQVPQGVYAVVDLYGKARFVKVDRRVKPEFGRSDTAITLTEGMAVVEDLSPCGSETADKPTANDRLSLNYLCSRNIDITDRGRVATRTHSFDNAMVFSNRPLHAGDVFEFRVDKVNTKWSGSPLIGVSKMSPANYSSFTLPSSVHFLTPSTWVMSRSAVFVNGVKVCSDGEVEAARQWAVGDTFGIVCRGRSIHMMVNGRELSLTCPNVPNSCYAVLDLYGPVTEVTLLETRITSKLLGTQALAEPSAKAAAVPVVTSAKTGLPGTTVCSVKAQGLPAQLTTLGCAAWQAANAFKASLVLPGAFFAPEYDKCFCSCCHPMTKKTAYLSAGNPPTSYSVPTGWSLFALRLPPHVSETHQLLNSWHMAYYGTVAGAVRKILDTRLLLQPADLTICGAGSVSSNQSDSQLGMRKTFVSPSISYASHEANVTPSTFSIAKRPHTVRIAFKVLIRPGSYTRDAHRLGSAIQQPDEPNMKLSEMEWSTEVKGAVELCSLLIKVDPVPEAT